MIGTLREDYVHVWYLSDFFLEWEMAQTEKIKTNICCSIILFSQNRAVYETA